MSTAHNKEKLPDGYHTLDYFQWTGKTDKTPRFWHITVQVKRGRIVQMRRISDDKWCKTNMPAVMFVKEPVTAVGV